jgi:hypothetical protein
MLGAATYSICQYCQAGIHIAKLTSVPVRWPEPNAGVARHAGGQHIWLLIFLVLFVSRQKEHNV